jgi:hypothetical protein
MPSSLLDRQVSLIHHLTSADTIFGGGCGAMFGAGTGNGLDKALHGIDPRLLQLEARFSHDKRMEKIVAVFPRTFALLGTDRDAIVAAFTAACPPTDISRIENARQFYGFTAARWRRERPEPRYLPDVAALELACANSRAAADYRVSAEDRAVGIRRDPSVVLLRTIYDVRAMFENGARHDAPIMSEATLAIATPAGAGEPMIFELTAEVFDLLAALDQWTDPDAFAGSPDVNALVGELAAMRLLELRR